MRIENLHKRLSYWQRVNFFQDLGKIALAADRLRGSS